MQSEACLKDSREAWVAEVGGQQDSATRRGWREAVGKVEFEVH